MYTQGPSEVFLVLNIHRKQANNGDDDKAKLLSASKDAQTAQTPMTPETLDSNNTKANFADSYATPATDAASEDMTANAARPSKKDMPAQQAPANPVLMDPKASNVSASENPIGPQLFEMARCATELVVHATEEQLAQTPATQQAITRARLLADFNQYMHRAVGEFANGLL